MGYQKPLVWTIFSRYFILFTAAFGKPSMELRLVATLPCSTSGSLSANKFELEKPAAFGKTV
jgi:hypothetical protein